MVTLVLPAGEIPDLQSVRKVTGSTVYTLRHKLPLYGEGSKGITMPAGIVYLVGENSVSGILATDKVAWDCKDQEAIDFLEGRRSHK